MENIEKELEMIRNYKDTKMNLISILECSLIYLKDAALGIDIGYEKSMIPINLLVSNQKKLFFLFFQKGPKYEHIENFQWKLKYSQHECGNTMCSESN